MPINLEADLEFDSLYLQPQEKNRIAGNRNHSPASR